MFSLLMAAIRAGEKEVAVEKLKQYPKVSLPQLVNTTLDNKGYKLIHYLAGYNHAEALDYLLTSGVVSPHLFTEKVCDMTPLQLAAQRNAKSAVNYLEQQGFGKLSKQQREAFDNLPITPLEDELCLLDYDSPLFLAVAVGNLLGVQQLVPLLDNVFKEDDKLHIVYMQRMFDIALENHQLYLLPLIIENMRGLSSAFKLNCLKSRACTLLFMGSECSVIEYIEKNCIEPHKVINMMFVDSDIETKVEIIFYAAEKACLNILRGLLAEFKAEAEAKKTIIRNVIKLGYRAYEAQRKNDSSFFTAPDAFDVAIKACANDLNHYPDALAKLLFDPVVSDNVYVVDALLKRATQETKEIAFSTQFRIEGGKSQESQENQTLMHLAVLSNSLEPLLIMRQHSASFDEPNKKNITARQIAEARGKVAKEERLNKQRELVDRLKGLNSTKQKRNRKEQQKQTDNTIAELDELNNYSREEWILSAMSKPEDQTRATREVIDQAKQSNLCFQLYNKMMDSELVDDKKIDQFTAAMDECIRHKVEFQHKYALMKFKLDTNVRMLWKAILILTQNNFDQQPKKIFRSLYKGLQEKRRHEKQSQQIVIIDSSVLGDELNDTVRIMEFAVMLEEFGTAFNCVDEISEMASRAIKMNSMQLIHPSEIIVARLGTIFCRVLNVTLPYHVKILLRRSAEQDRFDFQQVVGLLSYIKPQSLTQSDLKKMWDMLSYYIQDLKNFNNYSLVNVNLTDSFKRRLIITYANIGTFYQWLTTADQIMCPNAMSSEMSADRNELETRFQFLKVKSQALTLLKIAAGQLEATLLEFDQSSLFADMKSESEKVSKQEKRINEHLEFLNGNQSLVEPEQATQEMEQELHQITEEVLIKPPIDPYFVSAIEKNDQKYVLEWLKSVDSQLLQVVYQDNKFIVADYTADKLIETGQLEALKLLFGKLSDTVKTSCLKRLLLKAVAENQRNIVDYLTEVEKVKFATRFHSLAYYDIWPGGTAGAARALEADENGNIPLAYAISGGGEGSFKRLFAITPKAFIDCRKLLIRCIQAKQIHLLPVMVADLSYKDIRKILPKLIGLIHRRFPDPIAIIDNLISHMEVKEQALSRFEFMHSAMCEGFMNTTLAMLNGYNNEAERFQNTYALLKNISLEYLAYHQARTLEKHHEKLQNSSKLAKIIYLDNKNEVIEKTRVNQNIKNNCAIARLTRFLMKSSTNHADALHEVLLNYHNVGHDGAMREFLANLPEALAKFVANKTLGYFNTNHIQIENSVWRLLCCYSGGNTSQDDLYLAEKQLDEYIQLINKLLQGQALSVSQISSAVINIKNAKIRLSKYDDHLHELWNIVSCCGLYRSTDTHFVSAYELAKALVNSADEVAGEHHLKCAWLAFILGRNAEALEHVYKYDKADSYTSVQAALLTCLLKLCIALNKKLPPDIKQFLLMQGAMLSERTLFSEKIFQFMTESQFSLDLFMKGVISDEDINVAKSRRLVIPDQAKQMPEIVILETKANLLALVKLLLKVEVSFKERSWRNNQSLSFYSSLNKAVAFLKILFKTIVSAGKEIKLSIDDSSEISHFDYVDKTLTELAMLDISVNNKKSKAKSADGKAQTKVETHKNDKQEKILEKDKRQKAAYITYLPPKVVVETIPQVNQKYSYVDEPYQDDTGLVTAKTHQEKTVKLPNNKEKKMPKVIKHSVRKVDPVLPSVAKQDLQEPKKVYESPSSSAIVLAQTPVPEPLREQEQSPAIEEYLTEDFVQDNVADIFPVPVNNLPLYAPAPMYYSPMSPMFFAQMPVQVLPQKPVPVDIDSFLRWFDHLAPNQFKALLVGGAVRDLLENKKPADLDIYFYGSPYELMIYLQQLQHMGIIGEIIKDGQGRKNTWRTEFQGMKAEFICTLPTENGYYDDAKQDALNRDFTINAMYWHPDLTDGYQYCHCFRNTFIIDPLGGRHDLNNKILRLPAEGMIQLPKEDIERILYSDIERLRFKEASLLLAINDFIDNPIRLFRAFRFAKNYGFTYSPVYERALQLIQKSPDRVFHALTADQLNEQYNKLKIAYRDNLEELQADLKKCGIWEGMENKIRSFAALKK